MDLSCVSFSVKVSWLDVGAAVVELDDGSTVGKAAEISWDEFISITVWQARRIVVLKCSQEAAECEVVKP